MRTAVTDTSRQAYREIRSEGQLNRQHRELMAVMKPDRDYSLQELVQAWGKPVNVVSGRVNELVTARRLVRIQGVTRKCSITGRTIHPVRLPVGQLELFGRALS